MKAARDVHDRTLREMTILAALMALGSRFAGKILTTALGWASTLLFGRVPADRQFLVLGITFGSVIWMVLLAGVLFPDLGAFLLLMLPPQNIVPEGIIRLGMLLGAIAVPAVVGGLTLALQPNGERTPKGIAEAVARGYPLTAMLAVLLVFLAGLAIWRKVSSIARGWTDAHVPIVVGPGAYDQVAADLDRAVTDAGLEVEPKSAPATMSAPARWLAKVAGKGSAALVPDRMIQLDGPEIDILIYPMDLLISGKPRAVARARAAMASRLTTTAAHLTTSAEGQAIEDRLTALVRPPADDPHRRSTYDAIAETELAVHRRDHSRHSRSRTRSGRSSTGSACRSSATCARHRWPRTPSRGGGPRGEAAVTAGGALSTLGRWIRTSAGAVLDAATDEKTGERIEDVAGADARLVVQAAAIAGSGRARRAARCRRRN